MIEAGGGLLWYCRSPVGNWTAGVDPRPKEEIFFLPSSFSYLSASFSSEGQFRHSLEQVILLIFVRLAFVSVVIVRLQDRRHQSTKWLCICCCILFSSEHSLSISFLNLILLALTGYCQSAHETMRHIFGTTHIGFSTQRRILSPPNVFKSNWEISSSRILQPVREAHNHRLWKPTNITRQYSRTWIYQRASAVALFTSLLAFHVVYGKPPRLLEAGQDDDEEAAAEDIFNESSNYRPILKPLSMEMAEEILRWNESSEPLQEGSSVLRLDQVRVASNNEVEDYLNVAKGSDPDGELRWIMTGVYDGHA